MPEAGQSGQPREGQIVTFYSFKGGTGRTMALANVAWILAANGKRVLMADWDLESPGLHRFFQPFMNEDASSTAGIVDLVRRYEWKAIEAGIDPKTLITGSEASRKAALGAVNRLVDKHIDRLEDYDIPLTWRFPEQGALHFLSPGETRSSDYQVTLQGLDWENFWNDLHGPQFFDALRTRWKRNYDYVLIDSRTGLSDVADICTVHLPDMVVDCFTLSTQGIEGAAMIAGMIRGHSGRKITMLPVPMRIDHTQKEDAEAGLTFAAEQFEGLPAGMTEDERSRYWAEVEVPYRSSYAYEEMLAAFGDRPGSQTSLLSSYERIAARITGGTVSVLPPMEEWRRLRTRAQFSRSPAPSLLRVVLRFSPEDQLWAEWAAAVLVSSGIDVRWAGEASTESGASNLETKTVAIVSESSASRMRDLTSAGQPDRLISVSESRLPPSLADVPAIFLGGLSETEAMDTLIDRFNGQRPADSESGIAGLRYPGGDRPRLTNVPARNANFTGRDEDLRKLREDLRAHSTASLHPLNIRGLSGVGKTQVALEYAHRFKADYDIIWWMNCGQAQYIDTSLADLGQTMRTAFNAALPEEGGVTEIAQQVLELLSHGRPDQRWLLIYDNAEEIEDDVREEDVRKLLPSGGGHVLITSREGWKELGSSIELDVFKREESIGHLRQRKPGITDKEADQVAKVLGDMPLAVAAAGALIADINTSVPEYLRQLDQQPEIALPKGHLLHEYPVEVANAWSLSLDHLQMKSPPAARVLEICSVMAPDISLDLINCQAMADTLKEFDSTISERAMIARLVRQLDLLALIKIDTNAQQIQVHNVVQAVVKERMTEKERQTARRAVHRLLAAARPDDDVDDPRAWPRYRRIWPHLTPSGALQSTETPVRQLLIERVRYLRQRDDLARGRRRAEEIRTAWQAMLGRKLEPEMAGSLQRQLLRLEFNLANILRDLAKFRDSHTVDEAVLAGQENLLGKEHPHTLQTSGSLAGDLRALGDYQAALDFDLVTYKSWNEGFGEDHWGALAAAHNLALSYLLTGAFQQALSLDRQTLTARTVVLGPGHPRTFDSGTAVVRDLLEAGRYNEAVTRAAEGWAKCRDALGRDDRITLNARRLLGVAQRCVGHVDLAVPEIDAARAGLTRGFGGESSDALAARLSQALNLMALGEIQRARTEAEAVLAVYEPRLGTDHPHSLICRLNIATALCLEQDYQTAAAEARLAADGLERRLGATHPYSLAAKMVLASVLAGRGDLTGAGELDKTVAAQREQVLGPLHPDTLRSQANLLLLPQEGAGGGTPGGRQQVIRELAKLIGVQHPDVIMASNGGRLLCVIDPQPF
jgi:MinD-like ATPase involved in chromosome partitioning or flagellar assembly